MKQLYGRMSTEREPHPTKTNLPRLNPPLHDPHQPTTGTLLGTNKPFYMGWTTPSVEKNDLLFGELNHNLQCDKWGNLPYVYYVYFAIDSYLN